MESQQIRNHFLNFFRKQAHEIVPSSSLVPINDPTLLFTNAGMVQFKEVFLGEERPYRRAATIQRCLRAGGKHNDLENVGYTCRHHTFFEMLGNFSFADYFKSQAITYAWQFLTEVLQLPAERLWVTVFDQDLESEKIWLEQIKIDPTRFSRCGEKDNFWSMGDVGPCGPCTEIFYDHGPQLAGGPPGSPDQDGDRYVEIWNLVFMQYNRDANRQLHELPKPCVDTGMGLERIAAVMQGVHDNYQTDLFMPLLRALAEIIHCQDFQHPSMRVIVDHIRSAVFLIYDGVLPANEGRAYVLRRIIRRAIRHGYQLGQRQPFFYRLTSALVTQMADVYPELILAATRIEQIIKQEEIQFFHTLEHGMRVFEQATSQLSGQQIPGQLVFQLYDTFGFPIDLTADMARERGLTLDYAGYEAAMAQQRHQSQQAHSFKAKYQALDLPGSTQFTGYEQLADEGCVMTLVHNSEFSTKLMAGQAGMVVLDRTPFYAESGGQVGDKGLLTSAQGCFEVEDTQKQGAVYLHYGQMRTGYLQVGDCVQAQVHESRRDIVLNHSATHLLHAALRQVLGEHVVQKGSLVAPERLRFDFAHTQPLTQDEMALIETLVNDQIRLNQSSQVVETNLEQAKQLGALALFNEKYGEQIRVVSMGNFSTEVCGGTHVHHTGEIGLFKITAEYACAAGVRRIEAVTGHHALRWVQRMETEMQVATDLLKVNRENVVDKLEQILQAQRDLQKELDIAKQQLAIQQVKFLQQQVIEIEDIKVLAAEINADRDRLRYSVDQLKQQLGEKSAIVLASVANGKVQLVAGVGKACLAYFKAPQLLQQVARQISGRGGGRDDLAQGGGEQPEALVGALHSVKDWVREQLT